MIRDRETSGIFVVKLEPQISDEDNRGFDDFVDRIAELPMGSRYKTMALRPMACFEAVDIWQKLRVALPEYQLGDQWFCFNQEVRDHYGFAESGQDMLRVQMPRSSKLLVADVAGYLFGFPYEQMLIAAGSLDYVAGQVTHHYSQRYTGLVVTAGER